MAYNDVEILRDVNGNPIPQYYDENEGVFKPDTGKSNVRVDNFPATQQVEGNVQLTGSFVERAWIHDSLEIRDTSSVLTPKLDLTNYKYSSFYIRHNLDQPLKITIRISDPNGSRSIIKYYDGQDFRFMNDLIIDTSQSDTAHLLNTYYPELEKRAFGELTIELSCDTPPSSGVVRLWLEGVKR